MNRNDDFRSTEEVLRRAFDLALEVVQAEENLPPRSADSDAELAAHLTLGRRGRSLDDVVDALRQVLLATPSSASPGFLNQLFAGRDPVATMAEMLTPMTNTSMYTYKVAGPQVLIEREVISRMAAKCGFEDGDGILSPGGSLSNLTAMIVARNVTFADAREHGMGSVRPVVYTSEAGHYSIPKNAGILGIGRANVRRLETDSGGRLEVAALRRALKADLIADPESVNVCFEVRGASSAMLCNRLDATGRLKIGHGVVNGHTAIRLVLANPDLEESDIDHIFGTIKATPGELPTE